MIMNSYIFLNFLNQSIVCNLKKNATNLKKLNMKKKYYLYKSVDEMREDDF